ncbi:MAG: sigma 54-interacting transcriptional regulator, partial [Verrucomicrobiales bacterium]|nr:sigma 54-interacting transcriptional regulator [Verrucomicrobiales bacterium]
MEIFSAGVGSPEGALQRSLEGAEGGSLIIENLAALGPGDQIELVSRIESTSSGFPRILATCGPDLHDAVTRREFRSDLYYRLQVLEIRLPPLRERLEDLPVLTEFFVAQLAPGRIVETTEETLKRLIAHDWPGNLRELRNVISYALTAGAGASQISPSNLPPYFFDEKGVSTTTKNELPVKLSQELSHWLDDSLRGEVVPSYDELSNKLEAALLRDLLRRFDGKLARLANELKANRSTLRRKLGGTATPR